MITVPQSKIEKAAAKDKSRPVLTGVYYHAETKCLVAADGHIMAVVPVEADDETKSCIIPAGTIKDAREMGTVNYKETGIHYPSKHGAVTVQPIEGNFPDYTQIIPLDQEPGTDGTFTMAVDARKLLRVAEAICPDKRQLYVALTGRVNENEHNGNGKAHAKPYSVRSTDHSCKAIGVIMGMAYTPPEKPKPELEPDGDTDEDLDEA